MAEDRLCWHVKDHADPVPARYALVRQRMGNEGVSFTMRLLCDRHAEAERAHSTQVTLPVHIERIRPFPGEGYGNGWLLGTVTGLLGDEVTLEFDRRGTLWLR